MKVIEHVFNLDWATNTYLDYKTGAYINHSNYAATQIVDVHDCNYILFEAVVTGENAGYSFYDSNTDYLSGSTGYGRSDGTAEQTLLAVPENAWYFAFTTDKATMNQCYLRGVVDSIDLISKIKSWSMIRYPFLCCPGYYVDFHTGSVVAFTSGPYAVSTLIPICSRKLLVTAAASFDDAGYAFYDNQMNYITGGWVYTHAALRTIVIDVPVNASYFRFSNYSGLIDGTSVVGILDAYPNNLYDYIPWLDTSAYNITTGELYRSGFSGAKASDCLFLRDQIKYLKGWDYTSNCFYMNLYDDKNVCLGSLSPSGYKDTSGNSVQSIDYYSFSMTLSAPYTYFNSQEIYFEQPVKQIIKKNAKSVSELQSILLEAADFANPCKIYEIHIASGTYNLWDGLDWTKISGNGDDAYKRGLEIPSYVDIYGDGLVVLDLTVPASGRSYSTVVSCLNTHCVEASIHNIMLTTYDGRYCVHDDSWPNVTQDHTIVWENCIFEHRGRPDSTYTTAEHCYGAGFYSGAKAVFRNCIFKGTNSLGGWAGVAIHGHAEQIKPFYCEIENCAFLSAGSAVLMNGNAYEVHPFDCSVNNCYFVEGDYITLKGLGNAYLFGGGNSSVQIVQDNPNNIFLVQ